MSDKKPFFEASDFPNKFKATKRRKGSKWDIIKKTVPKEVSHD